MRTNLNSLNCRCYTGLCAYILCELNGSLKWERKCCISVLDFFLCTVIVLLECMCLNVHRLQRTFKDGVIGFLTYHKYLDFLK